MSEEKEKSNKKKGLILWIIILLLMGTNGYTIWLLLQEQSRVVEQKVVTETVIVERDNVKSDLLVLQKDYEGIVAKDALMQKDIDEKKERQKDNIYLT